LSTTTATATRTCRILYYGPAGSGKRANLARIQASLPQEHRLAVATDDPARHIAFLLRNGRQGDWQVFVQAVDAGQEGAPHGDRLAWDGVVFVCDSRSGGLDTGLSAMEALKGYLDGYRLDIMSMPMVLQYDQRDGQDVLAVDRLESLLNPWGLLSFPAASGRGEGVRETLKAILSLTIGNLLQRGEGAVADAPVEPEALTIDPNPPVPGTPHTPGWDQPVTVARAPAIAPEPAPPVADAASSEPIVVPVTIPRRALGPDGQARIVLDIRIADD
jgi:hypothetical protein